MKKFNCHNCGECCLNFGTCGTLPLFNNEKKRYEKLAFDLEINVEFIPENVMIDNKTGVMICSNWGLKGNPCPFLDKNCQCRIYEDRALICKAFPIEKVPFNNDLNLGCFMKCLNFDHKKFIESGKGLVKIYGKNSVMAREQIQKKQKEISEKIFGLISLKEIELKKIENFYTPYVISVEDFLEIIGI
jgi:Fe-S-cluster containining protein